ncbi:MAG TPA: hypothetical protein VJ183_10575 [Chloroflexia bacterium]|nr:hypothetical protein [Chloroflexia bacterium]
MNEDDFDIDPNRTSTEPTPKKLRAAKAALKRRCDIVGIPFEERNEEILEIDYVTLQMPSGREKRKLNIFEVDDIRRLLAIQFENYTYLSNYDAICSYKDGIIEAAIRALGPGPMSLLHLYWRLTGYNINHDDVQPEDLKITLHSTTTSTSEIITIGPMSEELDVLTGRTSHGRRQSVNHPSIHISGLHISRHDEGLRYLERVANSVFFEIDLKLNLSLTLIRERAPLRPNRGRSIKRDELDLQFPHYEYHEEPISLYWYARSARGMPLLQFLAYYQSIEFYFPIYSQMEAQRRVRNILKDPAFNPQRDPDIARLLSAVKLTGNKGYGDERSQLRATLQECLSQQSLREFAMSDEERKEFLSGKQKALDVPKLSLSNPTADLRSEVADRIYDIRCKIVHTKSGGDNGEVDLLLPFSKEAEALVYDIELIQYVSQQVLIAASMPLQR